VMGHESDEERDQIADAAFHSSIAHEIEGDAISAVRKPAALVREDLSRCAQPAGEGAFAFASPAGDWDWVAEPRSEGTGA
jgi:hypothetical protein